MTTIVPALATEDYTTIADLADYIWTEHYTPIIGKQQVDYMLEKFQSATAIRDQIDQGYSYYLLVDQGTPVGYFSFRKNEDFLFLSKLYVLSSARGNGIGKAALLFIEEQVKERGLKKIQLTVNKYNLNSINAYEKMGFINTRSIVQDIGGGFVMDDYVLEKGVK